MYTPELVLYSLFLDSFSAIPQSRSCKRRSWGCRLSGRLSRLLFEGWLASGCTQVPFFSPGTFFSSFLRFGLLCLDCSHCPWRQRYWFEDLSQELRAADSRLSAIEATNQPRRTIAIVPQRPVSASTLPLPAPIRCALTPPSLAILPGGAASCCGQEHFGNLAADFGGPNGESHIFIQKSQEIAVGRATAVYHQQVVLLLG